MAEQILFHFAEEVLVKLGSHALREFELAWGVKKDLKRLKNTMITIKNVLLDAEEQQVTNRAVREWLQRLKDILYDVDNVVDEFATEALRRQMTTRGRMVREVLYFFTNSSPLKSHYRVGRKIKDIRERLNEVVTDMKEFEFAVKVADRQVEVRGREETYSFVRSSDVIGRENDKEAVIKELLCANDEENTVPTIPIVGMGGLGKTTLAQLVYNDQRVSGQFSQRIWVCVSDNFDIRSVMIKLLKAVEDIDCEDLGIERLQNRLREVLRNQKYFLVLDDVWNEDRVEWIKVRDMLMVGSKGSRILVTTRSMVVASIMGTIPSYELKGLSDDDCLSVFLKWAFKEGDDKNHQILVNIGREIVRKCGGVPLAARTLGGLLYSKSNKRDWVSLRDNGVWAIVQKENDVLPVLRFSYDQMPSYLKQCFAYCSLFLKNQEIYKWKLIYLWMAQGFILSSEHTEDLEDIGEHYFNELVRRSFLQEQGRYYKMHDLFHDLALFVAGGECSTVNSDTEVISERVKHVLFSSSSQKYPESLFSLMKLRTFVATCEAEINMKIDARVFSNFGYLRVLVLNITNAVPSSIGNLKHLRYLTIAVWETTLPASFGELLNLQYLYLFCPNLGELPRSFENLINLRYLHLTPDSLLCLPEKVIGGLTSLRTFYIIGENYSNQLTSLSEGIRHLTCLRHLGIFYCQNLASLPSGMRYLSALETLEIESCPSLKFSEDDFQGLRNLKSLFLFDLKNLVSLPKGLQDSATTLDELSIEWCLNLKSLPIWMQHLTALRILKIITCPDLTTRCIRDIGEDWCNIAHIPDILINTYYIKRTTTQFIASSSFGSKRNSDERWIKPREPIEEIED